MCDDPLPGVRSLCLALPEVTERLSHGQPTWFIRGKTSFVMYSDHLHGGPLSFWCAAPPGAQDVLVAGAPDRYYIPPYVGGRGWLGVRLDVPLDWAEIGGVISDAYRTVAPQSLLAKMTQGEA